MAEATSSTKARPGSGPPWVGQSIARVEDSSLLTGRGRFMDDIGVHPGTMHAAFLRSPHAYADILSIDVSQALAARGVVAVLHGEDIKALTSSLVVGVKAPVECWPMAVGRVRYVGEPVAIVVAADRYCAEDAVDLIDARYEVRPAVVDPRAALKPDAPVLHDGFGGNIASDRSFRYGDPESAFASAPHRISIDVSYPRNSCTPIETYGVVADYDASEDAYDVLANFQGPFSIHAVLSRALKVPGNRLRLRTPPDSGGSFGVKQGVFPYIVLIAAAARAAGRPVKWIEDRLEHLTASVSATNRAISLSAAVTQEGRILALDWDQVEDCGAHLRAPEPATLYRMHGNLTGAYDIRHMNVRNRVVVTNKTPTGLNRGFGGPQVYFALERLVQRIALELKLDPLDVITRNLVPADAFPYRTASGALLDSGNYQEAVRRAVQEGTLAELKARRDAARAEGRFYGIGYTAVVEPSVSNMGYITTVLTPAERRKAGPKNGAQATATVAIDPVGSVTVHVASVPQGQGHRTVLSQVVADVFGLKPSDIRVNTEIDTAKDAWSIASGNYASRFAPAVAGTAKLAAERIAGRMQRIAASQLNTEADDIAFVGGNVGSKRNPDNKISFSRVAALSHWSPGALPDGVGQTIRETVFWTPPELTAPDEDDHINSSLCHGFIFDFCGVEVDRTTLETRIDRYVTMHDCGTILHPAMVDGQVRGGFAQAVGAALYEEYAYAEDGSFLTGTLADYLLPTAAEVPTPVILHMETPSPFTPLGSKGVGEGNCMSTPVCIANAVTDAIGAKDLVLPLVPAKLAEFVRGAEPAAPARPASQVEEKHSGDRKLRGEGEVVVKAIPQQVWDMLLDPNTLAAVIPGCHGVEKIYDTHFRADVTLGIGPVKGRYRAEVKLSDLDPPKAVTLAGHAEGGLGFGNGEGRITLRPAPDGGTVIHYVYEAGIGGKVASIGGRLLDGAAKVIIGQFFAALARKAGGGSSAPERGSLFARLRQWIGGPR
ncbi:xanthine dehydrogenase family protein molybdopterin-binding subunit [Bradyrhizobium erythrophlei]|uniref:Xanthine dehydrogenase, molybdenum binding subunit apoprotein n=1 Tax=Bradyrhizobium erythrophlei TaxID=1437360 RepID=A0A1M7TQ93_9BRAD|nr:molybdopterin cofactor-binding domain-containing protein [Bradyrhizobium erythrophlei]SHN72907.1 xanthine dehydrogenase, molybdenum binding subunit apoprotein [Bradyrhizobium erythrophlei]